MKKVGFVFALSILLITSCSNATNYSIDSYVTIANNEGEVGTFQTKGLVAKAYFKDVPAHGGNDGKYTYWKSDEREMHLSIENTTNTSISFKGEYWIKGRMETVSASGQTVLGPAIMCDVFYDSIPANSIHYYYMSDGQTVANDKNDIYNSTHFAYFNREKYSPCEEIQLKIEIN